jgi:hypothetical protein
MRLPELVQFETEYLAVRENAKNKKDINHIILLPNFIYTLGNFVFSSMR